MTGRKTNIILIDTVNEIESTVGNESMGEESVVVAAVEAVNEEGIVVLIVMIDLQGVISIAVIIALVKRGTAKNKRAPQNHQNIKIMGVN